MYLSSFDKKVNVTFVRHGTTKFNEENRVQGGIDIPLSEKGINEINLIKMKNIDYDIYFHSPLSRSKDTLIGILNKFNKNLDDLNIKEDILITERQYGIFEGLTKKEIKEKYPNLYEEWLINENVIADGIESIENVIDRIKLFISKIISFDYRKIFVVTHSGFLYALFKYITDSKLNLKPSELEIEFYNCCVLDLNINITVNKIELILSIDEKLYKKYINF